MTREEFSQNLARATLRSHELGLACVESEFKHPFSYLVELNASYDGNQLEEGEVILPEIRAKGKQAIGPLSHEEVVRLLWSEGLVPEWVDITPWEARPDGLTFQLLCCGRFAMGHPHMYHTKEGYPPIHAPGVWIPPDWESVEKSGRFNLNWHFNRRKSP